MREFPQPCMFLECSSSYTEIDKLFCHLNINLCKWSFARLIGEADFSHKSWHGRWKSSPMICLGERRAVSPSKHHNTEKILHAIAHRIISRHTKRVASRENILIKNLISRERRVRQKGAPSLYSHLREQRRQGHPRIWSMKCIAYKGNSQHKMITLWEDAPKHAMRPIPFVRALENLIYIKLFHVVYRGGFEIDELEEIFSFCTTRLWRERRRFQFLAFSAAGGKCQFYALALQDV